MRYAVSLLSAALVIELVACGIARAAEPPKGDGFVLSGPYTHDNLTVYLVRGKDRIDGKKYLTLQEAMEQKKVVVHETGDVNALSVENVGDREVYIQSGDIVKGGKQDRTLARDLVLAPHSGKVPLDAFCVEHGRWSQRGEESSMAFGGSTDSISSKDMKVAARQSKSQAQVWASVGQQQNQLKSSAGFVAGATTSPSSLQLTLEDEKVKQATAAYVNEISKAAEKEDDAIGYAFAINGKLNSAEVYASSSLFKRLWPKLLNATAVEALAAKEKNAAVYPKVSTDQVNTMLRDAEGGKQTEEQKSGRTANVTRESEDNLLFECRDTKAAKASDSDWLHRSYMTKQ